jgi:hypothetical protein
MLSRAAANPPPCTDVCAQIPRYNHWLIIGFTEATAMSDGSCKYDDPGKFSAPSNIMPKINGAAAGTVDFAVEQHPPPINNITHLQCTGGDTYYYAVLYFTWTLHSNSTAQTGYGPVATFSSTWQGDLGQTQSHGYQIIVPVVRPVAETTQFSNPAVWVAAGGGWIQTLTPPSSDSNFDFTGEDIREQFGNSIGGCAAKHAPPPLPAPAPGAPGNSSEATWKVGQLKGPSGIVSAPKNEWGYDFVGYTRQCDVEWYRCFKVTPCGYTQEQNMQIRSPADPQDDTGWNTYTSTPNNLKADIEGGIIPFPKGTGLGWVHSQRGPNGTNQPKFLGSHLNECPADLQTALEKC